MDLGDVARQLRATEPQINGIVARHLRQAHPPVTLSIRANVLAIPTTGEKHTGLRARIAGAVTGWAKEQPDGAQVGVAVFPGKTFGGDAYYTLPAYMEGAKAPWRHPVWGNPDVWRAQPAHPYFYGPAGLLRTTTDIALRGAADEITRRLS
jgi:hypothetical protein